MENKVSIIIPCYNHGRFLKEAVNSAQIQTYRNIEIIIVDDGSDDSLTIEVLNLMKANGLRVIFQPNSGPGKARNTGILEATGAFILPLDADDKIDRTYVEKALIEFNANPFIELVYSKAKYFGLKEDAWDLEEYTYSKLLVANMIFSAAVFKRDRMISCGLYNEELTGLEDWEFLIRYLDAETKIKCIPEFLFYYRQETNSRNTSLISSEIKTKKIRKKIFELHSNRYIEYYGDYISLLLEKHQLEKKISKLNIKYLHSEKFRKSSLLFWFTKIRKALQN